MRRRIRNLANAGLAALLLSCSDAGPTAPYPKEKPPVQQTQPLAIPSTAPSTCFENTLHIYQTKVTGGTGNNRTYRITKPSWLNIDQSGLITGICPEVSKDSLIEAEWSVNEGTNSATQKYNLGDRNTSNSYTISTSGENRFVGVNDTSLTFANPVPYNIGDILAADTSQLAPFGVLRKITSISDDKKEITTEQATLEEVIKNGSFSIHGTLSPSSMMESFKGIEGVEFSHAAGDGLRITIPNLEILNGVVLNGYFELGTDFYFYIDVRHIKLEYLNMGNISNLTSDITVGINIKDFIAETKEVPIGVPIYLTPMSFPTPVGGIPVTITPKLGFYAGIKPINMNPLSVRVRSESSLEMGLKYDGEWNTYFDISTKDFIFSSPAVTGDWDMEVYLTPRITFLVDGIIGASAGIKAGLVMETSDNDWELHGKLAATLGVSAEVFSNVIASYTKDIFTYDTLLARGEKIAAPLEKVLFGRYQDFNGSIYLNKEIYSINPDGSDKTNITNTQAIYEDSPSTSPDGSKFAFSRLDYNTETDREIYVLNRITGALTRLTDNSIIDSYPTWSPDGNKIAYTSDDDIWIMDSDGSNQRNLTQTSGTKEFRPSWSPDGSEIAFDANLSGDPFDQDIYKINVNTGQITRLTSNGESHNPSWSSRGVLAFISYGCNYSNQICGDDIYFRDSYGSVRKLTNDFYTTHEVAVSWSPDGSQLVYQSMIPDGRGYSELWTMNADGSSKNKILDADDIHSPHWGLLIVK